MTRIIEGQIKYIESSSSPSGYAQRKTDTPWVNTTEDDKMLARESILVERERAISEKEQQAREMVDNPGYKAGALIIRSETNKSIAAQLGLDADELADRLARPDQNQGTRELVPDDEFKALMAGLGLSDQEARDRFDGRFWV